MTKKSNQVILKYLQNQAEPEISFELKTTKTWPYVLIIPVCGEPIGFLSRVLGELDQNQALVILCINRPDGHIKSKKWEGLNKQLIRYLQEKSTRIIKLKKDIQLLENKQYCDIVLINKNSTALNPNKAVGLARKTAADLALALIATGKIISPWIFSTDADVQLPRTYFKTVENMEKVSAISLPFRHITCSSKLKRQQLKYDFKLFYYRSGIEHTKSQYDYIPLGSTLIIQANAYAKVRGFPKKSGGEDFYLLNKIAKVGIILQPQSPVVEIISRISDRVPFGTGPALQKIVDAEKLNYKTRYYHPKIFFIIKNWKMKLEYYWDDRTIFSQPNKDENILSKYWKIEKVLNKAIKQTKTKKRWLQFIHEWFDAFRLLKSVHHFKEIFPDLTILELQKNPYFKSLISTTDSKNLIEICKDLNDI
ncbi:MAG: hypothetical protein L3J52_05420 [Proteobacteria bacterium]|nr:hypothetical protein [Pseudomonadota bacterium]